MILQKAPFLRILPAFMAGIMLEHYHVLPRPGWIPAAAAAVMLLVIYSSLSTARKFRLYFVGGCAIQVLVASAGGLVARQADIRNRADWFGHHIVTNPPVVLTLLERPVEKTKSFKAVARFEGYVDSARLQPAKGKIILYIEKSAARSISFGSRLVTRARLREIRSSGNPGIFDYHSFCLSDGITHQVYLRQGNFIQAGRQADFLRSIVNVSRVWTTRTFEKYFPEQKERGLAEALLIGYKDELDKGLVQSYSNTGVVHVIAISGLHLGLIYWLLLLVTRPLARLGWLRLVLVVASLWLFSIIAGGQPSVL
ncbi:MAG TPA: ComEC family competence protein, partial [Flavisolibacter sp.]